jgi:hypothetical protein
MPPRVPCQPPPPRRRVLFTDCSRVVARATPGLERTVAGRRRAAVRGAVDSTGRTSCNSEQPWNNRAPAKRQPSRSARGATSWPLGILAMIDVLALGVLHTIVFAGIDVPRDVAVVGFDNIEEASTSSPCLTTVHQDLLAPGRECALHAAGRIRKPPRTHRTSHRAPARRGAATAPSIRSQPASSPMCRDRRGSVPGQCAFCRPSGADANGRTGCGVGFVVTPAYLTHPTVVVLRA